MYVMHAGGWCMHANKSCTNDRERKKREFPPLLPFTYIIPFHKFGARSEALGHGHWLELQRMNSRLCPCHWLICSSRRTAAVEMSHFSLLLVLLVLPCLLLFTCLPLSVVICSKAGGRKPTTAAARICHSRTDGGGGGCGASRLWRAAVEEADAGAAADRGPLTDWLRDMQLERRRGEEGGGGVWMSSTSGWKWYKSMQGQDRCLKWSSASVRPRQHGGH